MNCELSIVVGEKLYKWNGYEIVEYAVSEVNYDECILWVENSVYGKSAYRFADVNKSIYSSLLNLKMSIFYRFEEKYRKKGESKGICLSPKGGVKYVITVDTLSNIITPDKPYYYINGSKVLKVYLKTVTVDTTDKDGKGVVVYGTYVDSNKEAYTVDTKYALGSSIFLEEVDAQEMGRFAESFTKLSNNEDSQEV